MKVSSFLIVGFSVFVLSGCSQKVALQSVEKPAVDVLKKDSESKRDFRATDRRYKSQ